ncbi:hypothetical protein M501DRAFT_34714 [Patellaria atrata CBS 101060]|uniref:Uncharacterized protein n=1 Tax=Patellaria atrata CBS 101060 TaxID=1346257 RepID=A0A9P4VUU9_9PEZI|nr:hypothetical protein M501DRAFT_34714 [Patellaria atrata CBS 101060]
MTSDKHSLRRFATVGGAEEHVEWKLKATCSGVVQDLQRQESPRCPVWAVDISSDGSFHVAAFTDARAHFLFHRAADPVLCRQRLPCVKDLESSKESQRCSASRRKCTRALGVERNAFPQSAGGSKTPRNAILDNNSTAQHYQNSDAEHERAAILPLRASSPIPAMHVGHNLAFRRFTVKTCRRFMRLPYNIDPLVAPLIYLAMHHCPSPAQHPGCH